MARSAPPVLAGSFVHCGFGLCATRPRTNFRLVERGMRICEEHRQEHRNVIKYLLTYLLTYLLIKDHHGQTGTDVAQARCVRPHMSRRSTRRRHSHNSTLHHTPALLGGWPRWTHHQKYRCWPAAAASHALPISNAYARRSHTSRPSSSTLVPSPSRAHAVCVPPWSPRPPSAPIMHARQALIWP